MSSPAVRSAAQSLAESGSWPASIPFSDTFNQWVDPATIRGTWSTLEFDVESDEKVGIGQHEYLERGTITVHVYAERGKAFTELGAAFDALRPVILGHLWPASISIQSVSAPDVVSPGGKGLHVHAAVAARYLYQHQGGL